MKITQTNNNVKLKTVKPAETSIGTSNRTIGVTSKTRQKKDRGTSASTGRNSIKANNTGSRISSQKGGCSGCSRSARNK